MLHINGHAKWGSRKEVMEKEKTNGKGHTSLFSLPLQDKTLKNQNVFIKKKIFLFFKLLPDSFKWEVI